MGGWMKVQFAEAAAEIEMLIHRQLDKRVINPGDLLIVTTDFVGLNEHRQQVTFTLNIRGRDMHLFLEAANNAELLWDDNKHWLNAPVNGPRVDTRPMSEIRAGENLAAIHAFYPPPPKL